MSLTLLTQQEKHPDEARVAVLELSMLSSVPVSVDKGWASLPRCNSWVRRALEPRRPAKARPGAALLPLHQVPAVSFLCGLQSPTPCLSSSLVPPDDPLGRRDHLEQLP